MKLVVPGATEAELQAVLAAAERFLEPLGVTSSDAAEAFFGIERWDDDGLKEVGRPRPDADRIHRIWTQAQAIAIGTACGYWRRQPPCGCQLDPFG